ncbi:MAG: menaquinone biosynthesis protein [Bacteroidetes bacterium]|nr:menaquinone biosynthesis protein [Bacteroidota bacterium]
METLRISAISYLNTTPFVYGIRESGFLDNYRLSLDVPSACAEKLVAGQVDIGIVPIAAIPRIPGASIVTDYCIGAVGQVKTVIMVSLSPLEKITTIYLDNDSRTSARLIQVLAKEYWKKEFIWKRLEPAVLQHLPEGSGALLIGDKTFGLEKVFPYIYDLAEQWQQWTSLPFVFACWVSRGELPEPFISQFNNAIEYGVTHMAEVVERIDPALFPDINISEYLKNNISYPLDDRKKEGLKKFMTFL